MSAQRKVKLSPWNQDCDSPPGVRIDIEKQLHPVLDRQRFISPILEMPPLSYVMTPDFDFKTLEEVDIVIDDPKYWLDSVIKAGFTEIIIYPCDYER